MRERIAPPIPRQRLVEQDKEIDAVPLGDLRENGVQILGGHHRRGIEAPHAHVQLRVPSAEIVRDGEEAAAAAGQGQKTQRLAAPVVDNDDERCEPVCGADVLIPVLDPFAAAERRRCRCLTRQALPDRSGGGKILEHVDMRDFDGAHVGLLDGFDFGRTQHGLG